MGARPESGVYPPPAVVTQREALLLAWRAVHELMDKSFVRSPLLGAAQAALRRWRDRYLGEWSMVTQVVQTVERRQPVSQAALIETEAALLRSLADLGEERAFLDGEILDTERRLDRVRGALAEARGMAGVAGS